MAKTAKGNQQLAAEKQRLILLARHHLREDICLTLIVLVVALGAAALAWRHWAALPGASGFLTILFTLLHRFQQRAICLEAEVAQCPTLLRLVRRPPENPHGARSRSARLDSNARREPRLFPPQTQVANDK